MRTNSTTARAEDSRAAITVYRLGEIILALHSIAWGSVLLWPGDIFGFARRFQLLYLLTPDWSFGVVFVLGGLVLIFITQRLRYRQWAHALLFGLWCFIGYLGLLSGTSAVTVAVSLPYFCIALLHAGKWWILSQERQQHRKDG